MKAVPKQKPGRLRFHSFELDLDTGELQKNGRRIRLQDQPARLLALLASRPGELVTRSEIQKALWEEDRIVEFDTAVNTAIKKVREALEDDPDNPKLVETLPRKGYRFIAVVEGTDLPEILEPPREEVLTPVSVEPQSLPAELIESPLIVTPAPSPVVIESAPRGTRPQWIWAVPLLVLGLIAGAAIPNLRRPVPPSIPEMRLEVMTPPTADASSLAISPDGLKIAYVAISEGRSQLRLRLLDNGSEQSLAGTDGALFPFWSPNSRSIGFFADGALKRIDIEGGLPRMLAEAPAGRGGAWNADDVILFTPNTSSPIFRVSAMGDAPAKAQTQVASGSHRHPRFLPDGRHFIYFVTAKGEEPGVYVGDLEGTDPPKRLIRADAAAEYASNHLLFVTQGTLFAQDFDPTLMTLSGNPYLVADQVNVDAAMTLAAVSVSSVGSMVYRTGSGGGQRQFVWYDRRGKEIETVGEPDSNGGLGPALSADGRHIAMYRTVDGNSDIWLLELERGVRERFTLDEAGEVNPVWSPDRHRIAFSSNRDGVYDLYVKTTSSPETQLLLKTNDSKSASSWSRDGRHLLYRNAPSPDSGYDIWALPFDDNGKPGTAFPVVQTRAEEREAEFSPDGKWIAYQSTESGRSEVYVQPFPSVTDSVRLPVSTNGGAQPRWGSDSELFYIALDGQLMAVPIRYSGNGREIRPDTPVSLFPTGVGGAVHSNDRQQYVVAEDGKRFLMNTLSEANSPITVILNWKGKP
jgi:Tol biopolymer transport system component/DNA-binding winged helix-turn-helix (wHTH) protein